MFKMATDNMMAATLKVGTNMDFVLKGKKNRSYRLICHRKDVFASLLIVFDIVKSRQ